MRSRKIGAVPGTFEVGSSNVSLSWFFYDEKGGSVQRFPSLKPGDLNDVVESMLTGQRNLLIFNNYLDTDTLKDVKEIFGIHSLTMEDIVNLDQRCRYDSYDKYDLCVVSSYDSDRKTQISILTFDRYVLVFDPSEKTDHCLNVVTDRILHQKGRICERDHGYLTYALLDSVVDSYFLRIEEFEKQLDSLDQEVETGNSTEISRKIFDTKRQVLEFKKTTWPLREMTNSIVRDEKSFLTEDDRNIFFLRDLQDHALRVTENADALRDTAYGLVEMHMNVTSIRMNEVMKVLTVITTIFTPIMFLSSIYGMNFEWIPEVHMKGGYEIFWLVIVVLSCLQIYYFRRKKWL